MSIDVGIINPYSEDELNCTPESMVAKAQQELRDEEAGWGCFIATAVYGDINAPEVQTLREFRDNVLKKRRLGRAAVKVYYSGVGERAARLIEERIPYLMPVIRKGLDYVVNQYRQRQVQNV